MFQQNARDRHVISGLRDICWVVILSAIVALLGLLYLPSWREHWYVVVISGVLADLFAIGVLRFNDHMSKMRGREDRGDVGSTFQSALIAFAIIGFVLAVCIIRVFVVDKR
jgi:hypothetical protein